MPADYFDHHPLEQHFATLAAPAPLPSASPPPINVYVTLPPAPSRGTLATIGDFFITILAIIGGLTLAVLAIVLATNFRMR